MKQETTVDSLGLPQINNVNHLPLIHSNGFVPGQSLLFW